jgi:hypothetical protein
MQLLELLLQENVVKLSMQLLEMLQLQELLLLQEDVVELPMQLLQMLQHLELLLLQDVEELPMQIL